MTKQKTIYSEELKQQVVEEVLGGKLTKEEAKRKYDIKGKSEVLYWIRKSQGAKLQWVDSLNLQVMQNQKEGENPKQFEEPAQEIKRLNHQLWLSELKVEALDTMINIAEKELKIVIRKKTGTRQSRKSKANTRK